MDKKSMPPNVVNITENSSREDGCSFIDRPIAKLHKYYLSGPIKPASEYVQWFENIRNLPETDVVVLHINSEGGDVWAAIQFLRVLQETKALTVASVEGMCMSAATMIFLACRRHEITQHSMFLFHNYSGVAIGKGGEMFDLVDHAKGWSEKLLRNVYGEFLTEHEIVDILKGKDLYMSGEDVAKRMQLRQSEQSLVSSASKVKTKKNPKTTNSSSPKSKK